MPTDDDTPTLEGATNVVMSQRALEPPFAREAINIQGDENAWKAIGFDQIGRLATLSASQMIAADPAAAQSALASGYTVVTNEAQLRAAVTVANALVMVVGEITLTQELVFNVPGVRVYGGKGAKLTRPGSPGMTQNIIVVYAPRTELHKLEITANNTLFPLVFGAGGADDPPVVAGQQMDFAVRINPTNTLDVSDFVLDGCFIHHVTRAIYMTGSPPAIWADRMRIVNNRIESFSYKGIDINWNTRDLLIENNWIWGRRNAEAHAGQPAAVTETHAVPGNAIWAGNYLQRCTIRGNDIAQCERHGIECWNDHNSNNATAMDGLIVAHNNVHDLTTPVGNPIIRRSMGISIVSGGCGCIVIGNHVSNTTWYGIELFNAQNSQGKCLVIGNRVENIIGFGEYGAWGISINSCVGVLITGNSLNNIRSTDNAANIGILVSGSYATGHPEMPIVFDGVSVINNLLIDAGNYCINAGGSYNRTTHAAMGLARNLTIRGNAIYFTKGRQHRPTTNPEMAVLVNYAGRSSVVKDNEFFYPEDMPPAGVMIIGTPTSWIPKSGFDLFGYGTVYAGHHPDATIVGTVEDQQLEIRGSNLSIAYQSPP